MNGLAADRAHAGLEYPFGQALVGEVANPAGERVGADVGDVPAEDTWNLGWLSLLKIQLEGEGIVFGVSPTQQI